MEIDTTGATRNVYVKQKIVVEDMEFGLAKVIQIRSGQRIEGSQVNAHSIPYDASRSVGDVLEQLLKAQGLS